MSDEVVPFDMYTCIAYRLVNGVKMDGRRVLTLVLFRGRWKRVQPSIGTMWKYGSTCLHASPYIRLLQCQNNAMYVLICHSEISTLAQGWGFLRWLIYVWGQRAQVNGGNGLTVAPWWINMTPSGIQLIPTEESISLGWHWINNPGRFP